LYTCGTTFNNTCELSLATPAMPSEQHREEAAELQIKLDDDNNEEEPVAGPSYHNENNIHTSSALTILSERYYEEIIEPQIEFCDEYNDDNKEDPVADPSHLTNNDIYESSPITLEMLSEQYYDPQDDEYNDQDSVSGPSHNIEENESSDEEQNDQYDDDDSEPEEPDVKETKDTINDRIKELFMQVFVNDS